MKKALICFCTFVFIAAVLLPLLPLEGEAEVYDSAIRLHVLANSDDKEDQALKLKVRDSVLELVSKEIAECSTRYDAQCKVEDIRDDITIKAQNTVYEEGYDYPIHVTLDNEYYPTREYDGVKMPAGTYLSLRVLIGEAEGQNWWCVLYPPLCTSTAKPETTLKEAGFTPSQIRILTEGESPKYKLKFRILEIFEGWIN
ncbi:MAG: stage II sporulation protein R [Clostridia bacterium]|nr:stage II sporulation protein R [Clostridia bacterium]